MKSYIKSYKFTYYDNMFNRYEKFSVIASFEAAAMIKAQNYVNDYLDGSEYPGRFELISFEVKRPYNR